MDYSDDESEMETAFLTPDASMYDGRIGRAKIELYGTANVSYERLDMFMDLFSDNPKPFAIETAILYFQRFFSHDIPEIKSPIISNLVTVVLEYMKRNKSQSGPAMREAAWLLTNLVFVTYDVVDRGGVNVMVDVIRETPSSKVKHLCIWAIGNISLDYSYGREVCRSSDFLKLLGNILEKEEFTSLTHMKTMFRTLLSIIFYPPKIDLNTCEQLVKACHKSLNNFERNREIICDTIECLSALTHSGSLFIYEQPGLLDRLLEVSMKNNYGHDYQVSYVRFLCRLLSKSGHKIEALLDNADFYSVLKTLFLSPRGFVRGGAAYASVCITDYSASFIDKFIRDDDVFDSLLQEVGKPDLEAERKDGHISMLCIILYDSIDRLTWHLGAGICNAFPSLVCYGDPQDVETSLLSLLNILNNKPNYIGLIDKLQVVDRINATALEEEPVVQVIKEHLMQMIDSYKTTKKPYTFKFCPRDSRESEAQLSLMNDLIE